MSESPTIPVLSRVLRERDALVAIVERLEFYADHKPYCNKKRYDSACDCGYDPCADDAAILLNKIRKEKP